jgi:hypothetical protein
VDYLKSYYSGYGQIDGRPDRSGRRHVFEDRFWNGLREGQWRYEDVMAYVALNPVNDGFCLDPANYRWSSFASVTRGLPCVYGPLAEPTRAA